MQFLEKNACYVKNILYLWGEFQVPYVQECVIKDSDNNRSKWILSFTEIWTISIIKGNDSMLMVGLLYQ